VERWAPQPYRGYWNVWFSLALGILLLLLFLLIFGRRPRGVVMEPGVAMGPPGVGEIGGMR
jgi:hypothetical protein